jgi:hypothetical protein
MGVSMLKALDRDQASLVAQLAKAVRAQRDKFLGNVAEADLVELRSARGEHNPTAALGFEPVTEEVPRLLALREAIAALSPGARSELYILMRIGQGELGAREWHRGLAEATTLGDETVTALFSEDPDLHDHWRKACTK